VLRFLHYESLQYGILYQNMGKPSTVSLRVKMVLVNRKLELLRVEL
jgi:hypothetical protein